jgi:hypothetical protein
MLAGMGSAPANGGRLQQRQSDGSLRDVIATSDLIALFGGASKKIRLGGGRSATETTFAANWAVHYREARLASYLIGLHK